MWFASYVHFICTIWCVVCIRRTICLHDRACGLHDTCTLFARQGVWFAWYVHFICTTGLASCGRYGRCVADQRWLGQGQVLRVSFTYHSVLRPFTSLSGILRVYRGGPRCYWEKIKYSSLFTRVIDKHVCYFICIYIFFLFLFCLHSAFAKTKRVF